LTNSTTLLGGIAVDRGEHVVAVAGLVVREGRVLAMRRAATNLAGPGLWETLSGRVEHGEEPVAAVAREIAEESGLTVQLEQRPFEAYAATRRMKPMIVILYRARYVSGEVRISDEHDAFEWLDADAFATRCALPPLVQVVRRALHLPLL
jgi:8-oxo-dGTP pyrophosphatase MutT (NUDIX family)